MKHPNHWGFLVTKLRVAVKTRGNCSEITNAGALQGNPVFSSYGNEAAKMKSIFSGKIKVLNDHTKWFMDKAQVRS